MDTGRNLISFVIVVAVVIIVQCSDDEATQRYPCCSATTENSTGCCICSELISNCSSLNAGYNKTLQSITREQCIFPETTPVYTTTEQSTTSDSETTILPTTPSSEDDQVIICLLECPLGFYESINETCEPCNELCKNCSETECYECKYGRNSTDDCCPLGTQSKTRGNITICEEVRKPDITEPAEEGTLYIIIGSVAGGVVVIAILVTVVVCLRCRRGSSGRGGGSQTTRPMSQILNKRRKRDNRQYDPMSGQLPSAKELENINKIPGAYENTATLDHRAIAQEAQQKQDKIGRYTNDPTAKKTIFNKISVKFRTKNKHKGSDKRKAKPQEEVPQLEYEDVESPTPEDNLPTETYENITAGQQDMPMETYEGVDPSSIDSNMPTEEYTTMDPTTIQPEVQNKPIKSHETEPARKSRTKKKGGKGRGADNPIFTNENPYANLTAGKPAASEEKEDLYENTLVSGGVISQSNAPQEDYENYQGPIRR